MPYLNWKEAQPSLRSLKVEPQPPSQGAVQDKHLLSVELTAQGRDELLPRLAEVLTPSDASGTGFSGMRPELRLDLPRGWILFWKMRDGESRLLIAHPEPEEWVTTAALSTDHASSFLKRLKELEPGASLRVGELATIGNVSNAEIVITLVSAAS